MPKPKSLAGRIALITGGAGGIGRATAARHAERRRLRRARRHRRRPRSTSAVAEFAKSFGKDVVRGVGSTSPARRRSPTSFTEATLAYRRARHRRLQRRHRLGLADRGHFARAVAEERRHSLDRLFPGLARGVPALAAAEAAAAISSSSPPRTASPPRPAPRPIARPRPRKSISRAVSRWKARRTASASTPSIPTRCCAARRSGRANGASSAPLQQGQPKTSSRRSIASARC